MEKIYTDRQRQVDLEKQRKEAEALREEIDQRQKIDADRLDALRRELGLAQEEKAKASAAEQEILAMNLPEEERESLLAALRAESERIENEAKEKEKYAAATEEEISGREGEKKEADALGQKMAEEIDSINKKSAAEMNNEEVWDAIYGEALEENAQRDKKYY